MALFQRQPIRLSENMPYSINYANKSVLVIGLGNPGNEYTNTRHNIGFAAIDSFAESNNFGPWQLNKKFKGYISENTLGSTRVILLKPDTFMNLSGESAQAVASFYKIPLENCVAIYDELSLPFGQIRNRVGGQSAGHNGVKSLMKHLGTDFGRIRVGINSSLSSKMDASNFVLAKFSKEEEQSLPILCTEIAGILTEYIFGGQLPQDTRSIITN